MNTNKDMINVFSLEAYDYSLPESLIAQFPKQPADESKLLVYDRKDQIISHTTFKTALETLDEQSVLFFNDSKVVKARIPLAGVKTLYKGRTNVLQEGELFYLQPVGHKTYQFFVRPGNKLKVGTNIFLGNHVLQIVNDFDLGRVLYFDGDIFELLDKYGRIPLPPYIDHDVSKENLYQTPVSNKPGSVASPTASLHFTPRLLGTLLEHKVTLDYVTLHVGIGTFRPIETKHVLDHPIHSESVELELDIFRRIMNYNLTQKKIIAVGTTSCRTLESLPFLFKRLDADFEVLNYIDKKTYQYREQLSDAIDIEECDLYIGDGLSLCENAVYFSCKLYIVPGFVFRVVHELITNFHLPKSSLMVLVAGFMGYEDMRNVYDEAIKKNYRFYSFGDAMRIR